MTNSFWFSNDGDVVTPPAVEPPYNVEESVRFDGDDNKLTRTPAETDGQRLGETGDIQNVTFNEDGSVTLTVADGLEPHQDLQGDYLQVGDTLTQDSAGTISTSAITAASTPYVIGQSVIFNDDKPSSLDRTFNQGNSKTFTYSVWTKLSELNATGNWFAAYEGGSLDDSNFIQLYYTASGGHVRLLGGSTNYWMSEAVLMDPAVWYHIVLSVDTTLAQSEDRVIVYLDGKRMVKGSGTAPSQNSDLPVNRSIPHYIGTYNGSAEPFDGYMADVQFVDGVALAASAFGEYNSNGVWVPKAADLTRLSPYDKRGNASEDWTSYWSGTIFSGNTYAFANVHAHPAPEVGDTVTGSNSVLPAQGQALTFAPTTPITVNTSVVLRGADGGGAGSDKLFVINEGLSGEVVFYKKPEGTGYQDMVATASEIGGAIHTITLYGWDVGGGNSAYLGAILVDGQYLRQGPTDNSQQWSNYISSNYTVNNAEQSFDGDTGTYGEGWGGSYDNITTSPPYEYVFTPPTPIEGPVEVWTAASPDAPYNNRWSIDTGSGFSAAQSVTRNTWVEVCPAGQSLVSYKQLSDANGTSISAIRVNGVMLVNSGAQWNTTKVWSSEVSATGGFNTTPANIFDGDISTWGQGQSNGTMTWTPSTPIPYSNSVRVHTQYAGDLILNPGGGQITADPAGLVQWTTLVSGSSGTITSITGTGTGGSNPTWDMIEVDGVVLVDGGYGLNGFHLDFSSADLGEDSSGNDNDWTANGLAGVDGTFQTGHKTITYTGTGSSQSITGLGFNPGLVWIKSLGSRPHCLFDQSRGVGNFLATNSTAPQQYIDDSLTSFDSDGFTVGNYTNTNTSGENYVAWCWNAGSSSSVNNDGSVTSQVRANPDGGFSIVNYTGGNGSGATVGHGLNSAPDFILLRRYDTNEDFDTYHFATGTSRSDSARYSTRLNQPTLPSDSSGFWNNTAPNSDVFTLGNGSGTNGGSNIVAYCWNEVAGESKFGSFFHDTSTTGSYSVDCGFRPGYILIKNVESSTDTNWYIIDEERGGNDALFANTDAGQLTGWAVTFTDTGFSWVQGTFLQGKHIFCAFANSVVSFSDKTIDSPIGFINAGGDVVGNYATWNPIATNYDSAVHVLTEGNLQVGDGTSSKGNYALETSTIAAPVDGKWYWEVTLDGSGSGERRMIGIMAADANFAQYIPHDNSTDGLVAIWCLTGQIIINSVKESYTDIVGAGDVVGIALDQDAHTVEFYINNVSAGVVNLPSNMIGKPVVAAVSSIYEPELMIANFGQKPWTHQPPAGYKALCLTNL